MRQIRIEVTEAELAAIRAKGEEAKGLLRKLPQNHPARTQVCWVAVRARILEFAARDTFSLRSTDEIAGWVRKGCQADGCPAPSLHTVRRTLHAWNEQRLEILTPRRPGRERDLLNEVEIVTELRRLHAEFPDARIRELGRLLEEHYDRRLSASRISVYLRMAKIRFRSPKRPSSR